MSKDSNEKKKSVKERLVCIFGSFHYTPPVFITGLWKSWKSVDKESRKRKIRDFSAKLFRILRFPLLALLLVAIAFSGYRFWENSQPQKIRVDYTMSPPANNDPGDEEISALSLRFNGSAARKEAVGQTVTEGVSLKPEIPGSWNWESDSLLVFQPVEEWGIGKKYQVVLEKTLFPGHIQVPQLKKEFTTPRFSVSLNSMEFYIDPVDPEIKRILATLDFNYPVDPASLEGKIRIYPDLKSDSYELENRDYQFELSYSDDMTNAYIVSEPIGLPGKDVSLFVEVDEGIATQSGKALTESEKKKSVTVAGISSFVRINSFTLNLVKNDRQIYDQVLILETTGEADMDDLLDYVEVWELPDDLPEQPGIKGIEDFHWNDTAFVTDDVIKLSRKVALNPLPNERNYSSLNSFTISAEPSKFLYLTVKEGAPVYGGYFLAEDYEDIVKVKDYPRELEILSEGNVLSLSGDKQLSLFSRGVSRVEYRIKRIIPDDINHLVSQSNGNITDFRFSNYRFDLNNISRTYEESISLNMGDSREVQYFSLDMSKYLRTIPEENLRYGLFMLEVGEKSYNNRMNIMDRRLVMVSDLGMLIKTSRNDTKDVFVQSIATGQPVAGAEVQVLGQNGIPLVSKVTGNDGHVSFPALKFSREENTPTAFIVVKDNDLSFLPYESPGRFLDYSGFDVGGIYGAGDPGTLTTQVFSDRGLYRPGDRVNGAFIVKAGDWSRNLGGTPLKLTVSDPKGQTIHSETKILSAQGINDFSFETEDYSATGSYTISLYLVKEKERDTYLGGTEVKVEEFLPDRLKVAASFNKSSLGWVSPEDLKAFVSVRNLYGAPASGNKVTARYSLSPSYLYFPQYRDYTFLQPKQDYFSVNEEIPEIWTDDEGSADFSLPMSKFESGVYRLRFMSDAYEKTGGRSVSAETSVIVSSLSHLVGYKADGDLGYIHKGSVRNMEFIAVNSNAERIPLEDISLSTNRIDYVSTLVKQPNGVYKYQSIEQMTPLTQEKFSLVPEGRTLLLDTDEPGNYYSEIIDNEGNVLSRFRYTVVGETNISRSLNRSSELEIKLDKSDYKAGEFIELSISAPYAGSGLITIEKDRVYQWKWFTASSSSTVQRIRIPASGLEGNGYITVSFIRAADSREIFMSPLSYGSVPFSLDKESRTQNISLDFPELVKPGEELPITYSSNKPGKIIIYAVDEGILQVGNYKLPDPISYFFRKQALEVQTAQILDLILPEYSVVRSVAAMGGGMEGMMMASNLNPFKRKSLEPAVFWSGVLDSGPEERIVTYEVPGHFNGSLRVMAVCVSNEAVGSTEESALVRDTFIIQPSAPLAAVPGDEFEFKATVANNLSGSGEDAVISLSLEGGEGFSLGEREKDVVIPEGKDVSVSFPVTVNEVLGSADLILTARAGGETSRMTHSLSIRPAVPYRTELITGTLDKDDVEIPVARELYPQFRTLEISSSSLPLGLAGGLDFYLEEYPYTCTEQILSITFPMLYSNLVRTLEIDEETVIGEFAKAIRILQYRQKSNGGFGIWTVKSQSYPLIDLYACHFLIIADEKGYQVPSELMEGALNRAEALAGELDESHYDLYLRSYSLLLLTKSGKLTTHYLEELRKDLDRNWEDWESGPASLHLASCYSLLQMSNDSKALLRKVGRKWDDRNYEDEYSDRLSYLSRYLTTLSLYEPSRLKDVSSDLLDEMADELEGRNYTTYSASMALIALQSYVDAMGGGDDSSVLIRQVFPDDTEEELVMTGETLKKSEYSHEAASLTIRNHRDQPLYYQVVSGGFNQAPPESEITNGVEVMRTFLTMDGKEVETMTLGKEYQVRIRVRPLNGERSLQTAIVDLLPACLEAQTDDIRSSYGEMDYIDIREDRLVLYGTLSEKLLEFSYPVKATSVGTFTVPPLFAEAMYDQSVWAMQEAGSLTVREDED